MNHINKINKQMKTERMLSLCYQLPLTIREVWLRQESALSRLYKSCHVRRSLGCFCVHL